MKRSKFKPSREKGDNRSRTQVIKPERTLTICRPEVFVVRNGVQTLCAEALMTLMELHGRPDRPEGGSK